MLNAIAIDDHAPLIALLSEQLELEATALQAADDDLSRLLHLGGLTTLTQLLTQETARLQRALLAPPPTPEATPAIATADALPPE